MMRRILLVLAAAACALWVGDYLSVRFQIPNHRPQFGSVQVRRYYAVPLKNNRVGFTFDPPAPQSCVESLFPHFGLTPCWYLRRHPQQRVDL
jgi:hypothetical protein